MQPLETVEGRAELLGKVGELNCFSPEERKTLAEHASVRHIAADGVVYAQLTKADSFAIIASGFVHKQSNLNRRDIGAKSIVGELPLLHRSEHLRRRTVGLVAKTDSVLVDIPYRALEYMSLEHLDAFIDAIAEDALALIERIDR